MAEASGVPTVPKTIEEYQAKRILKIPTPKRTLSRIVPLTTRRPPSPLNKNGKLEKRLERIEKILFPETK